MKFYVVGISSGFSKDFSPKAYGDALVYAPDGHTALSMVRKAGWTPNPGDVHLLGTEAQRSVHDDIEPEEYNALKDKAREEGVAIIWSSSD